MLYYRKAISVLLQGFGKSFLLIFLTIATTGISQKINSDSLWKIWRNTAESDTNRIKALYNICLNGYMYTQPDSAFYIAQMQYDFASKKNLQKHMAIALSLQGISHAIRGNNNEAAKYYLQSLSIFEKIGNKKNIASALNNLGMIYNDQGNVSKSVEYFTRSLKIQEEIGDKKGAAISLANIGLIYFHQNDFKRALEYDTASLRLSIEVDYKQNITLCLNNMGIIYKEQGDYIKAAKYYNQCLKIKEEINDKNGVAICYNNIGGLYAAQNKSKEAMEYYLKSLKIREEVDDKQGIAITLTGMAGTYLKTGETKKAIECSERALQIARSVGAAQEVKDASWSLFESYSKTGRYKDALDMHLLSVKMRDSISSRENQEGVLRQEMQYNYDKQKTLDEKEREKEKAVAYEKAKQQKIIVWIASAGLLLVLCFALFALNRWRIASAQKKTIEQQKILVEVKQKEILDSITYAKRLQDAILPPQELVKQFLSDSFIFYKPKDIVAGDFYWMHTRGSGKNLTVLFAVADCTGHGVPGAIVSVVCSNALNQAVNEFKMYEPGKILDKTRELVLETFSKIDRDVKDGMDISLVSIQKTENTGTIVQWAGANNSLWYTLNNEMKEIKAAKQSIGKTENPLPFETHKIELQKNDSLYLYSDGYADQFGGDKGKKFKSKALQQLLLKNSFLSSNDQKTKLEDTFNVWKKEQEQVDDVCVVGIKL